MAEYRLDKYLTLNGIGTRSQVKELIKKGQVAVDKAVIRRPEVKINTMCNRVAVAGKEIIFSEFVYYMLYKPAGVITATEDKHHKTVLDLLEDRRTDLFPVGRLDIDTEGLLLITNDGETGHRLLSPKRHVDKVYYVETKEAIPKHAEETMRNGINLGDFTSMPAVLERLGENCARITVHEGKFHQVKRMFEAVGASVAYLKRVSMGPIVLDEGLKKGEYRKLTKEEIEAICKI